MASARCSSPSAQADVGIRQSRHAQVSGEYDHAFMIGLNLSIGRRRVSNESRRRTAVFAQTRNQLGRVAVEVMAHLRKKGSSFVKSRAILTGQQLSWES